MHILVLAILGIFLALANRAGAVDLQARTVVPKTQVQPFVAPVAQPCTVTNCSGFYVGVDLTNVGSNADLTAGGVNKIFASGLMVGGHVGYQLWNGSTFAALEGGCAYETTNNLNVSLAGGARNHIFCTELLKAGVGFNGLFGSSSTSVPAPSQGPIPIDIPASLSHALISPYATVGAAQRFGKSGTVVGAGAEFVLAQGWNFTLEYLRISYSGKGPVVSAVETIDNENLIRLGLNRKF